MLRSFARLFAILVAVRMFVRRFSSGLGPQGNTTPEWTEADELRRLDEFAGVLFQTALGSFVGGAAILLTIDGHDIARVLIASGVMLALCSSLSGIYAVAARVGADLTLTLAKTRRLVGLSLVLLFSGVAVGTIGGGAAVLVERLQDRGSDDQPHRSDRDKKQGGTAPAGGAPIAPNGGAAGPQARLQRSAPRPWPPGRPRLR